VSGQDVYGRSLATCYVGGEDIQKWMVRSGYAFSFKRYSHAYDADEITAREARSGLWSGAFIAPWDWRSRSKSTEVLGAVSVPVDAQRILLKPDVPPAVPLAQTTRAASTSTHGGCGSRGGAGYRLANGKCASSHHKRSK
jgi:Staphylococcal nuclease homologue